MDGWMLDVVGLVENFVIIGFFLWWLCFRGGLVSSGFVLSVRYLVPPCLWSLHLYPYCITTTTEPHLLSELVGNIQSEELNRSTWFRLCHICATFLSLLLLQVSNIDYKKI